MGMTIEKLQNIVLQALEFGQNGKTKACNEHLRLIYSSLQANPLLLWESSQVSQLGKSIILMLHLDLIDDEEKMPETDICELFRIRKDRIILLKSFDDFFVDSLQEIYFANEKPVNREAYNEQRKAVLSRVPLMQFSDIFDIEQDYPNLRDDEFLLETANFIEMEDEITSDNLREANLLHKTLFKYELQRLKEGKMNY